jgi:Ser/Thr protein kinase RdoA (MazF antagonist)
MEATGSRTVGVSELRPLLAPFGLGEVHGVTAIQRSFRAHRLETSRGTFVLSVFGPEMTRDHLHAMQDVRRELAGRGLPVVPALSTADGDIVVQVRGRWAQVQPWVDHDGHATDWPAVAAGAGTLGAVHDAMATCTAVPDQPNSPWRWPKTQAERLDREGPALVAAGRSSGLDIAGAVASAERILALLASHGALTAGRTPVQLTHGDFQGRNVLMRGRDVAAVIDFDDLERRPRLFDLAWPLVFWRFFGAGEPRWSGADWRAAAGCCEAYAREARQPPDETEWIQLPLLMAAIPAYGVAQAFDESGPAAEVAAFARALPFAEAVANDPDAALTRLLS